MSFTTAQLNEAAAVAYQHIEDNAPILFAMEHPLLKKLFDEKKHADGERLQFPVNFNRMANVGAISGTTADVLDMNTQQNLTYASLDWKKYYHSFSITFDDLVRATGTTAVIDIIEAKAENTIEAFKELVHADLYGTAGSDPLHINGFGDIFAASGTSYGGLTDTDFGTDKTGDNLWLPTIDTSIHYPSYSNISPFITKIKSKKQTALDYLITTPAIYQRYKDLQQAAGQRYVGEKDLKSGFNTIMIDDVPMLADAFVSGTGGGTNDSYLFGITSKTMGIKYKFGWDKPSPMTDEQGINIPNQPVIYRKTLSAFNLYCNDRRLNFVMKQLNPTATS